MLHHAQGGKLVDELLRVLHHAVAVSAHGIALRNPPSDQTAPTNGAALSKNLEIEDAFLEDLREILKG